MRILNWVCHMIFSYFYLAIIYQFINPSQFLSAVPVSIMPFWNAPLMSEPAALHPLWLFILLIPAHFFITTALIMLTMQKQQMKFLSQIVSRLNAAPQLADRAGQEDALSAEKPADNEPNLFELAAGESMQETPSALPEAEKSWKDILPELPKVFGNHEAKAAPQTPKGSFFPFRQNKEKGKNADGFWRSKKNSSFSIITLFTKAKLAIITIVIFYFLIQLLGALNLVKNLFN